MQTLPANMERFLFEVSGSDEELRVVSFAATEGISQLFSIDLELVAEDNELKFEQFVGQAGVLTIQEYVEEEPRYLHGIISRFEQGSSGLRFTTYNATVVPKIWYLMHRHNCRIFQQKSVRDIVQQILDELGIPGDEYRFVLQNPPPKRDYCVQYRESELDFITRLLEEEGIFYFFEHKEDKHILVMGDSSAAHLPVPGENKILFHEPRPGQVADEPHIYNFNYTEEVLPGKVTLKDYNFKKPALNLKGEKTAEKDTELEIYDYPGKFEEPGRGKQLAKVRLEEYQAVKKIASGAATCTNFAAGFFFTMKEYPRKDFNKKYLLTQHQLSGSQPQVLEEGAGEGGSSFSSSFECIPFEVPYRPDRVTPKPIVEGSQTAIVVGPKGEEIYTDEHGRIKVQFHWDREGQMNEKSSCWIRVSQVWAGTSWGAMYIPRIGHEVIVDFLEGDPDRPLITGRVYHGTNKPPYPLPAEKTKSTVKSYSSKGGGGFNEIRLEDKKGDEQIFIHAEKDYDLRVKNDRREYIGQDHNFMVKRDSKGLVEGGENLTIKGNRKIHVAESLYREAKKELHERTGKKYFNKAGMEMHFKSGKKIVIDGSMDITLRAGGSFVRINASGVTIKGKMIKINSGGSPGKVRKAKSQSPAQPQEADNAKPGEKFKAPPPPETWEPVSLDFPTLEAQKLTLKEAAKNGTPFCEPCQAAAAGAAAGAAGATAGTVATPPPSPTPSGGLKGFIQNGLGNARIRREERKNNPSEDYGIKEALSADKTQGYLDEEPQLKLGVGVKKTLIDDDLLFYGDKDNNLKIGHVDASVSSGYGYDPEKGEHEISLVKLEGKISAVEANLKADALNGMVETSAHGEALSAAGTFTPLSVTHSATKTEIKSELGAEANLVKGEVGGQINITPKTIYDNTLGPAIGLINPKFAKAPDSLDHGIVIGGKGEAGIGAAAKAHASAKVENGVASAEIGLKAGFGPMAGFKLLLGVK